MRFPCGKTRHICQSKKLAYLSCWLCKDAPGRVGEAQMKYLNAPVWKHKLGMYVRNQSKSKTTVATITKKHSGLFTSMKNVHRSGNSPMKCWATIQPVSTENLSKTCCLCFRSKWESYLGQLPCAALGNMRVRGSECFCVGKGGDRWRERRRKAGGGTVHVLHRVGLQHRPNR